MRKPASLLALFFAALLLVSSLVMYKGDLDTNTQEMSDGFRQIQNHDDVGFNRSMDQHDSRKNEELILLVVGVGFGIAGIALYQREPVAIGAA
jgi:hypothetical protein